MANPTQTKKDDFGSTASRAGTEVKNKAQDLASTATEKAKDVASSVASTAGDLAHAAGEKADSAAATVGGGMKSLADTIRDRGPSQGALGSATSAVAGTLESGGKYLQEQGLTGMGEDLTELIRRNPLPAVLVGVGIGFLIARVTRG